ncbi:hypothetical protein H0R92_00735 [Treponema sp. OMZ 840]|uniref:hypothetical protein n=1 Tax=Treponema sp. OMZ 840 TaxID=244313 RepID=UPI003D9294F3
MKNKCCIFLAIIIIFFNSCSEYKTQTYNNLTNLDGGQSEDWIPFFLLSDDKTKEMVYNVYECHDLDTNQSWGYFFISDEKNIFEKSDYSQQKRDFNIQQMRKRLRKIGCFEDLDNYILIDSDSFFYFLFKEENSERFFFYGKYK